jgi:hypothetical protein
MSWAPNSATRRRLTLLLACFAAGTVTACGDDEDPCGEPVYGGIASDEAWRTMIDGDDGTQVGDADAPVVTSPAADAEVSAATGSLVIAWESPIATAPGPRRRFRMAAAPGWLERTAALFEGTAWAHLPPVTGDIYWIRITVPGRECTVEGLTTTLSWEVTGDAWDAVRATTGQSVSIDVTSAYLSENRITEGPFRPAQPRVVTIVP